jgi:peptidoglycan/LPS O-acetylase OafA/YrhL
MNPFSSYGEKAVEYFILLAGITYGLFSRSKVSWPAGYFAYLRKRLAALFPMFLLINVIIYLSSFYHPSPLGRPFHFVEFLASSAGVSLYLHWKYMSTVMWFMPFILQVYMLLPLVDWMARRVSPVALILLAFGVSCLLAQAVPFLVKSEMEAGLVCKNWSPVFRLPEVCVGIILGRLALRRSGYGPTVWAVAVFGILSWSVTRLESANLLSLVYLPWNGFLVSVVLFTAAMIFSWFCPAQARWLRVLGLASFPFYLLHAAPVAAISQRFHNQTAIWAAYFLACWIFVVGLTLMLERTRRWLGAESRLQKI